jgi:hypothetical protein
MPVSEHSALEAVRAVLGGWGDRHFREEAERLIARLRERGFAVVAEPQQKPYRYSVTCWSDDCTESLDTYGGVEVIDYAREHVERNGCALQVQVQSIIEVHPNAS